MEVLTDPALEQIFRQLEAYATALEDTPTMPTFAAFALLAEAFAPNPATTSFTPVHH